MFLKNRLTDLEVFETHIHKLITLLPRGEETIDLADLFMRFTMDVATEFLFGRSTDSLENPRNKFVEAFADVQKLQNIFVRAGYVLLSLPPPYCALSVEQSNSRERNWKLKSKC